jgi:malate dehydrogenase (oxaloacetate-decarboxylating)(NADP+)
MSVTKQQALDYHFGTRPGKIEVTPTKPCRTQRDLSLAYTPGVADPCLEIEKNPHDAYKYTARGNLVAVVSNGTAVLGLGDIGALAGKPVMEGKGVLFKRFADVDVFDLEVNTHNPDEVIKLCQLLEPTFGGINLEDIKAPECFYIEETLRKTMNIPVFHDDQHGTAIISGAALLNALEITGKDIKQVRIVFNGAGASGISCAEHYVRLGAKRENITLCDTKGVVYAGRTTGMNAYKERFAHETKLRTLEEAVRGCDVLVGLSSKGAFTQDMLRSMAAQPIVFAMANPDPEITYEEAKASRDDIIMATGRSDYPNQVNNVLGFPFIFRGALDVRATAINEEMKLAATRALAALTKEDVPDSVCRAYGVERLTFGHDYVIPKPFDPRVLVWEACAVAEAAMQTGVAQEPIDLAVYREQLERRLGKAHEIARMMIHKAQAKPKKVVFPEGENEKILRACHCLLDEKIAFPILLGDSQSDSCESSGTRAGCVGRGNHRSTARFVPRTLHPGTLSPPSTTRGNVERSAISHREPQCVWLDDGSYVRRRRACLWCYAAFSGRDSPRASNRTNARRPSQSFWMLCDNHAHGRPVFSCGHERQHRAYRGRSGRKSLFAQRTRPVASTLNLVSLFFPSQASAAPNILFARRFGKPLICCTRLTPH